MAFSRRLGVVWFVGASWLVAVGCDDSEDRVPEPSGKGGEAPSAGKSSVAGSQSNGGKAGSSAGAGEGGAAAGTAGTAGGGGDAGQGGGGGDMAGAAGLGGDATGGVGGAAGGQGGAAGGQGGAAGAGGEGGEGGAFEPVAAPHCAFSCVSDNDCLIDGDDTEKCNLATHLCEDPSGACTVDADCIADLSAWSKPCSSDANCTASTEACVDAGGEGFCAPLPVVSVCTGSRISKTLARVGAQGTIAVCAHPDARCFNRKCRPGCGTPLSGCGTGNGNTCSALTGLCGCSMGTECNVTGICGRNGRCQECTTNADCAANFPDTACIEGQCGCASATTCAAIDPGYESAPAVCQ